jgi:hypothetical protein
MFSLAFLECFTLVLAIGHLIVIQFLVFSVVQNCICYVFYSVCLEFCCFDDLVPVIDFSSGPVAHGQWKLIKTSDLPYFFNRIYINILILKFSGQ